MAWRQKVLPTLVFLFVAGPAAVFLLASLVSTGEPGGVSDPGWAGVALKGSVFSPGLYQDRVVLDESATAASRHVVYRVALCNTADKTGRVVHQEGLVLLQGRAMLSTGAPIKETTPYRKLGSLVLSRLEPVKPAPLGPRGAALSYHLDGSQGSGTIQLGPALEAFYFSETVFDCNQYSEFASLADPVFGFGFELEGTLGQGIAAKFHEGPFAGPHQLISWPEMGTPYYGLLARANFMTMSINGTSNAYEFPESMPHSTYEVDGGSLLSNYLTEEVLPNAVNPPQLLFSSASPIAPVVRLDNIGSQLRWQFVQAFVGVVFGVAAGVAATYLFETLRRVGRGRRGTDDGAGPGGGPDAARSTTG